MKDNETGRGDSSNSRARMTFVSEPCCRSVLCHYQFITGDATLAGSTTPLTLSVFALSSSTLKGKLASQASRIVFSALSISKRGCECSGMRRYSTDESLDGYNSVLKVEVVHSTLNTAIRVQNRKFNHAILRLVLDFPCHLI